MGRLCRFIFTYPFLFTCAICPTQVVWLATLLALQHSSGIKSNLRDDLLKVVGAHGSVSSIAIQTPNASCGSFLARVEEFALGFASSPRHN